MKQGRDSFPAYAGKISQIIDIKESWFGYGPPETWRDLPEEVKKTLGDNEMPLTKKGEKIKSAMEKEYGKKRGESVFYASINKGTVKGAEEGKHGKKEKGR